MRNGIYKRWDIHPVNGKIFWQYMSNGSEFWVTKEKSEILKEKDLIRGRIYQRKYRKLFPEKCKNSLKEWRLKNRNSELEKMRIRALKWTKENKARHRLNCFRYKSNKKNKTHPLHIKEIEKSLVECAVRISKCLGIPFEVDHIIPLKSGGEHYHLNLQVLPKSLNCSKRHNPFYSLPDCYKTIFDLDKKMIPEQYIEEVQTKKIERKLCK